MGLLRRGCLLLPLALLAAPATGQQSRTFRRVAIPDDVPAHLVTALAEDKDGFLWIGTQAGLVRYDGYEFRSYKPEPGNAASLGGSYVRTLLVAADGRLWMGTFGGGVSVYDPARETFERHRADPTSRKGLSHDRVEALAEDQSGGIWIATYEGLDRLDPATGIVERHRHDPKDAASLANDRVRGLLVDRKGRLWVGTRDGLQVREANGRGFERVASDPGVASSLAGQFVSNLFQDSRGRIWIGTTDSGAAVLDPETRSLRRLPPRPRTPDGLSHFWVYGITESRAGEIWLGTFGGGVDVVDPDSHAVKERLRHDPTLETTLGGDRVGAVMRDRSGAIWVGTWGQGLARADPGPQAFRALQHSPNRRDGLSHPAAVRALELEGGPLFVGTNGNGVDVLDERRGLERTLRANPGDRCALADGSVTCLAQGPDRAVWVATLDGTLHRLKAGTQCFERLTPAQGLAGGPIRALTFDRAGLLWAGAAEGLSRIDPASLRIASFRHRQDDPTSLSSHAVEAIEPGPDGALWIGTDGGLNLFDPVAGVVRAQITHEPGRRDSLPNNWVPDLMTASDGRLWVATQGGAAVLTRWDGRTASFESVSEKTGRVPGPIESLIEDRQGWVWLGPKRRVNPRTWEVQEFGAADGNIFRSFFIASRSRTAAGTLLFGSPERLLLVKPEAIEPWRYEPPLVATALSVDGIQRAGALRLRRLTLAPGERGFRLEFAALDFTSPQQNTYRYRLDDFDAGWLAASAAQRSLTFTNLPPGEYALRVQGSNRAGLVSKHELRLAVTVEPALHQRTWFRFAIGLAGVAAAYAGYRLRVRRLRARERELEETVRDRTHDLGLRNRELEDAYLRIEEASLADALTGLRNRRFLDQTLGGDIQLSARRHRDQGAEAASADLVFLLLDLDHFKSVNDGHGHAAGDAVLVQVAAIVRAAFRASDHAVRWGGEEFLVVARFVDRREAPELAEKLRAAIEAHEFRLEDGTTLRRTCSIGFASYPFWPDAPAAVAWQEVLSIADLCLYAAKRSGRNCWIGLEAGAPADRDEAMQRLKQDPASAIASGAFSLRAAPGAAAGSIRWS